MFFKHPTKVLRFAGYHILVFFILFPELGYLLLQLFVAILKNIWIELRFFRDRIEVLYWIDFKSVKASLIKIWGHKLIIPMRID